MKLLYEPQEVNWDTDTKTVMKAWDTNLKQLEKQDKEAKRSDSLVGRYITEPVADGHAYYQIIKENKATVKIRLCVGLGDDWQVHYWGVEANIDKDYALQSLENRDATNF